MVLRPGATGAGDWARIGPSERRSFELRQGGSPEHSDESSFWAEGITRLPPWAVQVGPTGTARVDERGPVVTPLEPCRLVKEFGFYSNRIKCLKGFKERKRCDFTSYFKKRFFGLGCAEGLWAARVGAEKQAAIS